MQGFVGVDEHGCFCVEDGVERDRLGDLVRDVDPDATVSGGRRGGKVWDVPALDTAKGSVVALVGSVAVVDEDRGESVAERVLGGRGGGRKVHVRVEVEDGGKHKVRVELGDHRRAWRWGQGSLDVDGEDGGGSSDPGALCQALVSAERAERGRDGVWLDHPAESGREGGGLEGRERDGQIGKGGEGEVERPVALWAGACDEGRPACGEDGSGEGEEGARVGEESGEGELCGGCNKGQGRLEDVREPGEDLKGVLLAEEVEVWDLGVEEAEEADDEVFVSPPAGGEGGRGREGRRSSIDQIGKG